ncbi:alpha/beta-hydrolase [Trichodelitschia bisporula]|uniref:Carboxylic ester hydrolase n=1 Tax=Trichodelitschia bisporula TaxID=703511 RepID=A0A6G1IBY3_9PEZI|nr:alpha/beta-hydrolase [Trichodelitschia bisporula]
MATNAPTSFLKLAALSLATLVAAQSPTVTLDSGVYRGLATSLPGSSVTVHKYLGIPFAEPPERFGLPQPLPPSTAVKSAEKGAPACPENTSGSMGAFGNGAATESEDCLYLNVFTPAAALNATEKKTVMVWFFGGGLQFGSASMPGYDGTSFATNQDVVLVATNYRTNIFGFPGELPFPGLQARTSNLGFLDQRAALQWVQDNIAKFGGDPSKVTIFGESAGARSVDFHLLTTQDPPFRAVIMQSGSAHLYPGTIGAAPKKANTTAFLAVAEAVGCPNEGSEALLHCMRAVPLATLKAAVLKSPIQFGAEDDQGFTTLRDSEAARLEHRVANVSLMIGTNADEQKATIVRDRGLRLAAFLKKQVEDDTLRAKVAGAYKVGAEYKTEFDTMAAVATDMAFTCVTSRESRISAQAGYPTWRFLFNASFPNSEAFNGSGAYHSSEIQYVFGNLRTPKGPSKPEEISLSKAMQTAWATFAKNPLAGPGWARVGSGNGSQELGEFNYDGKLHAKSPAFLDRHCVLFEEIVIEAARG